MIVELKKVKITKSIANQLQMASISQLNGYEVLGWYINKTKNILFYHSLTKSLAYYPYFDEVKPKELRYGEEIKFRVEVCKIRYNSILYGCDSEQESIELMKLFNLVKHNAILKGQLFI